VSGGCCASASSGQATSSSSALGIRSFVAKRARASATTVFQPSSFAVLQSASDGSTAPLTKRIGGGPKTSAKTV
jgi:hypothetical protein